MSHKLKIALALTAFSVTSIVPVMAEEASPPTLKISGNSIVNMALPSQTNRQNGKGFHGFHINIPVSDLYFLIQGKTANGFNYGYRVNFEAYPGSSPVISQNYIELSHNCFGVLQLGAVVGPEDSMIKDGNTISAGTGAADGAYGDTYNRPELAFYGNDNIGDTGYATKVVYYTPVMGGLQLGFGYTPNTNHMGDSKLNTANADGNGNLPGNRSVPIKSSLVSAFGVRSFVVGMSYKAEAGKWSFTGTGSLITDKSYYSGMPVGVNRSARYRVKNTLAYQLGMVLGYKTCNGLLQAGAGFLDNGKSRLPREEIVLPVNATNDNYTAYYDTIRYGNAGKAWNLGTAYSFGAYKVSATYQRTDRKTYMKHTDNKAHMDVCSVGGEVTPVQGLKFFSEVNYIRGKTNARAVSVAQGLYTNEGKGKTAIGNNIATVVNMGVKVSF